MTNEEYNDAVVEKLEEIDKSLVCLFHYAHGIMWAAWPIALAALSTCAVAAWHP